MSPPLLPTLQLDWDSQTPAAAAVLLHIARFTAAASNLPGKAQYQSWLTSQVLLPWAWANGEQWQCEDTVACCVADLVSSSGSAIGINCVVLSASWQAQLLHRTLLVRRRHQQHHSHGEGHAPPPVLHLGQPAPDCQRGVHCAAARIPAACDQPGGVKAEPLLSVLPVDGLTPTMLRNQLCCSHLRSPHRFVTPRDYHTAPPQLLNTHLIPLPPPVGAAPQAAGGLC